MLLIDDIMLAPFKGLMWTFRKIHEQAEEEQNGEAERIRDTLTDLYRAVETGAMSEEEFQRREEALLDRLETLEARDDGGEETEE